MSKHWSRAFAAAALGLMVAGAHAGNVYWSIGIQTPPVATVISSGQVYQPYYPPTYVAPPVVYQAPPAYYQPAPVYYQPAPVYYAPPPVFYRPAPLVVYPSGAPQVVYETGGAGRHHHWHDSRRDEYGTSYRGGDWQPGRGQRRWHH